MKAVKTAAAARVKNPSEVKVAWGVRDVEQYTGLTRVAVWKHYNEGTFPKPHYVLGNRKWWKADVERWVAEQNEASVKTTALNPKRVVAPAKARKGGAS